MRRRDWERKWRRDDEALETMLLLVGYEPSREWLAALSDAEARAVEWWAGMAHLRASDNPVRRYPRPSVLPEPWKGEGEGWSAPTVLRPAVSEVPS